MLVKSALLFHFLVFAMLAWASDSGVSHDLAQSRASRITRLQYDLRFEIPGDVKAPIQGFAKIDFVSRDTASLLIDFRQSPEALKSVHLNGSEISGKIVDGHIELSPLKSGVNSVELEFAAGEQGFHRRDDFLYTLFVPDNASKTFPCFDQPDLKGTYNVTLKIPKNWVAVSQASEKANHAAGDFREVSFGETKPTSTYLIAFAAGKFQVVTRTVDGRKINFYHRETDGAKVGRNLDAIFELHGKSLKWLENYTGIKFPFEKFDFVALPAFPFGGMEHPGSIFYSDKMLFLDPSATRTQYLDRAHLIAHETSHAWFGDLVTMRWFDDVWLKEVFASFMADKIADPIFPEINHDLRFFLQHYPAAYSVDRTRGTHPIHQELENLANAGSLYGAIIYSKAPIVMRQLEEQVGAEEFRKGIRTYLKRFRFANASWSDLIAVMGGTRLKNWNEAWINQAGRPTVELRLEPKKLIAKSEDSSGKNRLWPQKFSVWVQGEDFNVSQDVDLSRETATYSLISNVVDDPILTKVARPGYGLFKYDDATLQFVRDGIERLQDENLRAVAWVNLKENMYENRISPREFIETALRALPKETQEITIDFVLANFRYAYWAFLSASERDRFAVRTEKLFWDRANDLSLSLTARLSYFKTFQSIFLNDGAWKDLHDVWGGNKSITGMTFSELDKMSMAYALALRKPSVGADIRKQQIKAIKDPERQKEFEYVMTAAMADPAGREAFFERLTHSEERKNEPWVADALFFLHHPLHGREGEKYIVRSLQILPEIKSTGGIFFPLSWLTNTLQYHVTPTARGMVETYLKENVALDPRLQQKLLQASDVIFRFGNEHR